ncbi:hypothetical protein LL251_02110 [Sphingobium naphthae]|nr:hypothetical protein [Sphingobium naphthae]
MGKVLRFPVERRQPHVALTWDDVWDQYQIAVVGVGPNLLQWCSGYPEAIDLLISLGQRFGLPIFDLTPQGKVA